MAPFPSLRRNCVSFPSSPLCSDCTNLSCSHGGDVSLSVSLPAHGEASMNCSDDSDSCTGTESLFFNLMQQRSESFTAGETRGGKHHVCMSVCLYFKCLFIQFSQHAWFFNYTATLCHWELTSAARFFPLVATEQLHWSIWILSSNVAQR